jgi:ribosomal protein S18 acetylase RimI-like enzyme
LRAFLSLRRAETIVAEREGHIVAFVLGWRRSRTDAHVITLDVAAPVRRHRLGRRLLLALERRFRAAGVRPRAARDGGREHGLHAWKMDKALDDPAPPPPRPRVA